MTPSLSLFPLCLHPFHSLCMRCPCVSRTALAGSSTSSPAGRSPRLCGRPNWARSASGTRRRRPICLCVASRAAAIRGRHARPRHGTRVHTTRRRNARSAEREEGRSPQCLSARQLRHIAALCILQFVWSDPASRCWRIPSQYGTRRCVTPVKRGSDASSGSHRAPLHWPLDARPLLLAVARVKGVLTARVIQRAAPAPPFHLSTFILTLLPLLPPQCRYRPVEHPLTPLRAFLPPRHRRLRRAHPRARSPVATAAASSPSPPAYPSDAPSRPCGDVGGGVASYGLAPRRGWPIADGRRQLAVGARRDAVGAGGFHPITSAKEERGRAMRGQKSGPTTGTVGVWQRG